MQSISAHYDIVNLPPFISYLLGKELADIQWFKKVTKIKKTYLRFREIVPGKKIGYHSRGKVTWGIVFKKDERGGQFFWLDVEGRHIRLRFSTHRLYAVEVEDAIPLN